MPKTTKRPAKVPQDSADKLAGLLDMLGELDLATVIKIISKIKELLELVGSLKKSGGGLPVVDVKE